MARNGAAVILASCEVPSTSINPSRSCRLAIRNFAHSCCVYRRGKRWAPVGSCKVRSSVLGTNPITWSCLFILSFSSPSNSSSSPSYSTVMPRARHKTSFKLRHKTNTTRVFQSFPPSSIPFLSFPALVSCSRTTPTAYRHNAATTQQPYVPPLSHFRHSFTVCTYTSSATSPGLPRSPLLEVARIYLR